MATLAFYKKKGTLFGWLVRTWTRSNFSHVELIVDDVWYTAHENHDGTFYYHSTERDHSKWDFIDIDVSVDLSKFFKEHKSGYDWWGIFFTHVIPLRGQHPEKWFCSELVAYLLGYEEPHKYAPGDIYNRVVNTL